MNLGEFTTLIRAALARGAALDSIIPIKIAQAARWMELDYSYKYMDRFAEVTLDADATQPRVIELPSERVKKIQFIRIVRPGVEGEERYWYLEQKDAITQGYVDEGLPDSYWMDGVRNLYLNRTPDENYQVEMAWIETTPWPTGDQATHWLLENASDALEAKTMLLFRAYLRDTRLTEVYTDQLQTGLHAATKADEELRQGNANPVMQYS